MKNLRKLVPQEEINALFREVYQENKNTEITETTISKSPSKKHKILAYKLKKLIRKVLIFILPVSVEVKEYQFLNSIDKQNLINLGYDLENKYRLYVSVENNILDTLEDIWQGYNTIIKDNTKFNPQKIVETFLEKVSDVILEDSCLEKERILSPYLSFYEEDISVILFKLLVEKKELNVYISFDDTFLEFADIKPIIFSRPTKTGIMNMEKLKRKTYIPVVYETQKFYLNVSKLRKGEVIDIKTLSFRTPQKHSKT